MINTKSLIETCKIYTGLMMSSGFVSGLYVSKHEKLSFEKSVTLTTTFTMISPFIPPMFTYYMVQKPIEYIKKYL